MDVLQKIKAARAARRAVRPSRSPRCPMLFTFLNVFAMRSMNMPLTCRILFFMLKTHHKQIVASRTMRAMLDGIRLSLRGVAEAAEGRDGL